jgi:hypothetical protein
MNAENYYLYRVDGNGDAKIYAKFPSLQMAQISADLLLIKELSFILSEDITRIYFYNEDGTWDYDIITSSGKEDFLKIYPNPKDYVLEHK